MSANPRNFTGPPFRGDGGRSPFRPSHHYEGRRYQGRPGPALGARRPRRAPRRQGAGAGAGGWARPRAGAGAGGSEGGPSRAGAGARGSELGEPARRQAAGDHAPLGRRALDPKCLPTEAPAADPSRRRVRRRGP